MNINPRKTFLIVVDGVLAIYIVLAMTVLNTSRVLGATGNGLRAPETCPALDVTLTQNTAEGFLDKADIESMLKTDKLYPVGKKIDSIDIRSIEERLLKSPFISDAQCFKGIDGRVSLRIAQRTPVVRVKAENGDDYYVDSEGELLPNTKYTPNILVATGSISEGYARKVLSRVGCLIAEDDFWQNEAVQLHILPGGTIELVPRVGDHIVFLGTPNNIREKLDRLEKFYKYGLSQIGWNKYSYVNVAFSNQIICKKKKKK